MNAVAVSVLIFLFLLVTVVGFAAARWRRADLDSLDEWGLGGRGFGTFIAWFLIGGDLYTAYTFIAVPATLYAGSSVGFFYPNYTSIHRVMAARSGQRQIVTVNETPHLRGTGLPIGLYGK